MNTLRCTINVLLLMSAWSSSALAQCPQGPLVKAPSDPTVWVLSEGEKHRIVNTSTLYACGYDPADIQTKSTAEINAFHTARPIDGEQIKWQDVFGFAAAALLGQ